MTPEPTPGMTPNPTPKSPWRMATRQRRRPYWMPSHICRLDSFVPGADTGLPVIVRSSTSGSANSPSTTGMMGSPPLR